MPVYFLNVRNIPTELDEVGDDFPNEEAAWREATLLAGAILKDVDGGIRPGDEWSLTVTDQHRTPVFEIGITTKKLK
jgi:hypothetical protein